MSVEFWTMGAGSLRTPEQLRSGMQQASLTGTQQAVRAEEIGYDGIVYVDNQNGRVVGPATAHQRAVFESIHAAYDMHNHSVAGSAQEAAVTAEFEHEFGIFGPPNYCVERLSQLIELGIDRFILRGSPLDPADPDSASCERFVQDVVPQLRTL